MIKVRIKSDLILSFVCFCAATIVLAGWSSSAAGERTIRFGISSKGYPPYLMNKGKSLHGIVGDAFVTISQSIGFKLELIIVPEKRLNYMAERGGLDAIASAIEWETYAKEFSWTDGIIKVSDNVVMTTDHKSTAVAVDDLMGKHVALMLGYTYPSLEKPIQDVAIQFTRMRNFESLLRMVDSGRVDFGILDRNVANWVMREKKLPLTDRLIFSQPGFDEVFFSHRIVSAKGLDGFRPILQPRLGRFQREWEVGENPG